MNNGLYTTWLPDERYTWRKEIELGIWHEPYILQQYRLNRDSTLWRSTREVKKLCEYILHLEGVKPMSHSDIYICDNCEADISLSDHYPHYRLKLESEPREIKEGATIDESIQPEINRTQHFCNKECLKGWINK